MSNVPYPCHTPLYIPVVLHLKILHRVMFNRSIPGHEIIKFFNKIPPRALMFFMKLFFFTLICSYFKIRSWGLDWLFFWSGETFQLVGFPIITHFPTPSLIIFFPYNLSIFMLISSRSVIPYIFSNPHTIPLKSLKAAECPLPLLLVTKLNNCF